MDKSTVIIARRIAREMALIASHAPDMGKETVQYFMGLGVALGIMWEVCNGHPKGMANRRKPQEILEWAKNLKDDPGNRILIVQ